MKEYIIVVYPQPIVAKNAVEALEKARKKFPLAEVFWSECQESDEVNEEIKDLEDGW